jgi:outer membrane protein assembly factor BamA
VVEAEETGALATGELIASDGGSWLGLGAVATYDTRDHVVNPRQGGYAELSALAYPGALGTTGYRSAVLDLRRFLPLGTASTVAFRAYLARSGGDVPVLLLPSLGGRERLRGYYEGRARDRVAGSAQGEVRFPIWRRFGGVAFAEVGQVGPRLGELTSGRPEMSAGAGLRFRLGEEAARIRADFAVGRRGSGLYLTIGEAF